MPNAKQFIDFVEAYGRAPFNEESPSLYRWLKYQREKYRKGLPIKAGILSALESRGMDSYLCSLSYNEMSSAILSLVIPDLDKEGSLPSDHVLYHFWYRKRTGYYEVYDSDIELLEKHGLNFLKRNVHDN